MSPFAASAYGLRLRTLLLAGVAVAGAVAASYVVAARGLESSRAADEQHVAGERAEAAVAWLESEGETLLGSVRDYAHWDDAWAFVHGEVGTFLLDDFNLASWGNLGLRHAYFGRPGAAAYARVWVPGTPAPTDLDADGVRPFHELAQRSEERWGLLETDAGPVLYALAAIRRTDGSGEDGHVFLTTQLLAEHLPSAERLAQARLSLLPPGRAVEPAASAATVVASAGVHYPGASGWVMRVERDRRPAVDALRTLAAAEAAVGLLALVVTLGVLDLVVLRRLARLTREVGQIRVGAARRLAAPGADELDQLGRAFNQLMDDVDQAQERLRHDAFHDPLTGLANRTLLRDRLAQAIARARRNGSEVALLFVDLDRLKMVNDHLGHAVGDEFIQVTAGRLMAVVRPQDTVARLGGDEFAVAMDDLPSAHVAVAAAERILDAVRQVHDHGGAPYQITASVGVAFAGPAGTVEALLSAADTAMYAAKHAGRDRFAIYDADMHGVILQRLELERALRAALGNGELRVAVQPIVTAAEARLVGFEALARWTRPGVGPVSPEQFIGVAEDSPLIAALDARVLELALAAFAPWRAALPDLFLTVNCSARRFEQPGLAESVGALLARSGVPGAALVVEVTETLYGKHEERWADSVAALGEIGVRVALDDFGTGYSSLGRLRGSPVSIVKLDRAFVRDLTEGRGEVARAILGLARSLHLRVVAEGVEDEATAELLRELGCDWLQGWHYAPALELPDAAAWVARAVSRG